MKTTVLFGAGASIGAIPTIDEMHRHIPSLLERIKDPQVIKQTKFSNELTFFTIRLEEMCESLRLTQSPDESMRRFYHNSRDFDLWLKIFWVYINILQFGKRNDIGLSSTQKFREYGFTDNRYSSLVSDYLFDDNNNISFLSWNYDSLFEQAYMHMHSISDLESFYRKFTIYPSPYNNKSVADKFIHLNGASHFYEFNDNGTIKYQLTFSDFKNNLSIHHCLDNLLWILKSEHNKNVKISSILKFGFTYSDNELLKLKERINKSVTNSKRLVVIGYSFPKTNQIIDKYIFEALDEEAEIFIQNPISQKNKVERWFKIASNRLFEITAMEDMKRFIIE